MNLSYNQLKSLPSKAFPTMGSLNLVDLSHNSLPEIPQTLLSLPTITRLEMQSNHLSNLSSLSVSELSSLKYWDLSNNLITTIPRDLSPLVSLVYLNIRYNRLPSLPTSISTLSSLIFLGLSHNDLESMDEAEGGLVPIRKLLQNHRMNHCNLSWNQLKGFSFIICLIS